MRVVRRHPSLAARGTCVDHAPSRLIRGRVRPTLTLRDAAAVVARRARAGARGWRDRPALPGRRRRAIRQRAGLAAGRKAADVAALLLVAGRRTGRRRRATRAGAPGARVGVAAVDGRGLRTRCRRRRRSPRHRGGGDRSPTAAGDRPGAHRPAGRGQRRDRGARRRRRGHGGDALALAGGVCAGAGRRPGAAEERRLRTGPRAARLVGTADRPVRGRAAAAVGAVGCRRRLADRRRRAPRGRRRRARHAPRARDRNGARASLPLRRDAPCLGGDADGRGLALRRRLPVRRRGRGQACQSRRAAAVAGVDRPPRHRGRGARVRACRRRRRALRLDPARLRRDGIAVHRELLGGAAARGHARRRARGARPQRRLGGGLPVAGRRRHAGEGHRAALDRAAAAGRGVGVAEPVAHAGRAPRRRARPGAGRPCLALRQRLVANREPGVPVHERAVPLAAVRHRHIVQQRPLQQPADLAQLVRPHRPLGPPLRGRGRRRRRALAGALPRRLPAAAAGSGARRAAAAAAGRRLRRSHLAAAVVPALSLSGAGAADGARRADRRAAASTPGARCCSSLPLRWQPPTSS